MAIDEINSRGGIFVKDENVKRPLKLVTADTRCGEPGTPVQAALMAVDKLITEEKYGGILGVHIIGPRACSLIPEVALAMKLEATFEDIVATIHTHPALSEVVWESALDVTGEAIHFRSRAKG
jgi:hypothetical protein